MKGFFFMTKYSHEIKVAAVKLVVEEGLSRREVIERMGISKSGLREWLLLYDNHGYEGLKYQGQSYTGQFRQDVIEYMHANNLSIMDTAAHFGITSHTTVGRWERIYYEEGPQALFKDSRGQTKNMKKSKTSPKNKQQEDLIAEVQRLRAENAYLKKLQALVQERIQRENGKK